MDKSTSRAFAWTYAVVLVAALTVFAVGLFLAISRQSWEVLAAGCGSVIVVLSVWSLALNFQASRQAELQRYEELLTPVNERLQHVSVLLNMISEQQLISERAKTVAFRENDREAMRRAVREEIARKDWEAALALANEVESTFGYRQEADRLREEISTLRQDEMRKQVNDVVAAIDRFCRAEQWNQALREAERLMTQYPHDAQVQKLPQEIESRRQQHKKQLLDSWNEAVNRHDVDGGIEILKQLDPYLTPAEAESMQEVARRVFKDKLQLLGQQFTQAMKDHQWADALRLGDQIMRDFPNSRMAQEVQQGMELLRQRATDLEATKV